MKTIIEADDGRAIPVLTMGPIGITPELKRKGYGKALLDYSLEKAVGLGYGAVLFEGNIGFYGKCGFTYAREFGIRYHSLAEDADDTFFLCKELIPGYLDGIPVKEELDLKKAAKACGEKAVEMIKQKELLPLTGYIHGGCSPIGMKKAYPTFIQEETELYDRIFVSAGKLGRQIGIAPEDLMAAAGCQAADLVKE